MKTEFEPDLFRKAGKIKERPRGELLSRGLVAQPQHRFTPPAGVQRYGTSGPASTRAFLEPAGRTTIATWRPQSRGR